MNMYLPFNVDRWYAGSKIPLFIILSSFGIIGMAVLGISQLLMNKVFKLKVVKVRDFILWFLVEVILLSLVMYFIYGNTNLRGADMWNELFLSFKYIILVIIIPYAGVLFYLHTTQKGENIKEMLNAGNHLVKIMDENGELHMAIDLDQILFLKSADNYVAVFYLKDDKVRKELVRTTMKRLEQELDAFPIKRCHRSYMVNIKKLAVTMRNNQGLSLTIKDYPEETIPVSKNYKPFFMRMLTEQDHTF